MSEQIIPGGSDDTLNTTINILRYIMPQGGNVYTATESAVTGIVPTNGVFKKLRVVLSASPGVGKSWTFTLRRNGIDTILTTTILGTTTGADIDNAVRFSPGDRICLQYKVDTAGNANVTAYWSMVFVPDILYENILISCGGTISTAANNYPHPNSQLSNTTTVQNIPCPIKGVIKKFYARISTAPGAGASWTFTILNGGVATAVTMTINDPNTTGNDITNSTIFVPGDNIVILSDPSAVAPAATTYSQFGLVYELEREGFSVILGGCVSTITATTYAALMVCSQNASEALTYDGMQPCRLSNLYVNLSRAAGAGQSWTFTIRRNGVSSPVTVLLSNVTTGSDLINFMNFGIDDTVNLLITASAAPLSMNTRYSCVLYVDSTMTTVNNLGAGHSARIPHADNGIGLKRHLRSRAH